MYKLISCHFFRRVQKANSFINLRELYNLYNEEESLLFRSLPAPRRPKFFSLPEASSVFKVSFAKPLRVARVTVAKSTSYFPAGAREECCSAKRAPYQAPSCVHLFLQVMFASNSYLRVGRCEIK